MLGDPRHLCDTCVHPGVLKNQTGQEQKASLFLRGDFLCSQTIACVCQLNVITFLWKHPELEHFNLLPFERAHYSDCRCVYDYPSPFLCETPRPARSVPSFIARARSRSRPPQDCKPARFTQRGEGIKITVKLPSRFAAISECRLTCFYTLS